MPVNKPPATPVSPNALALTLCGTIYRWLEYTAQTCSAPWSLAWSILALDAHSRPIEGLVDRLFALRDPPLLSDSATLAAVILVIDCLGQGNGFKAIA
jgi:hypothetical protein